MQNEKPMSIFFILLVWRIEFKQEKFNFIGKRGPHKRNIIAVYQSNWARKTQKNPKS